MEKIADFLKTSRKMSKKKRRLINDSKRKLSIPKLVIINTFDKSGKKGLLISALQTKRSTLTTKEIDMAIIGVDTYHMTCGLKKTHVFALSMRDLKYQA